jgi:hypothetical protein
MLTADEKVLIERLKVLDNQAKKAPWYPQGAKSKDKTVYRVGKAEEDLIIAMRNSLGDLLKIAQRLETAK